MDTEKRRPKDEDSAEKPNGLLSRGVRGVVGNGSLRTLLRYCWIYLMNDEADRFVRCAVVAKNRMNESNQSINHCCAEVPL